MGVFYLAAGEIWEIDVYIYTIYFFTDAALEMRVNGLLIRMYTTLVFAI
jgi:hypothetical protein